MFLLPAAALFAVAADGLGLLDCRLVALVRRANQINLHPHPWHLSAHYWLNLVPSLALPVLAASS